MDEISLIHPYQNMYNQLISVTSCENLPFFNTLSIVRVTSFGNSHCDNLLTRFSSSETSNSVTLYPPQFETV